MIPGNRPEDTADEAFWLALEEKFEKECPDHAPIIESIFNGKFDLGSLPNPANQLEAAVVALVTVAREMGYNVGFDEGKDQQAIDEAEAAEAAAYEE